MYYLLKLVPSNTNKQVCDYVHLFLFLVDNKLNFNILKQWHKHWVLFPETNPKSRRLPGCIFIYIIQIPEIMLKNYFKTALRGLLRNKMSSLINLLGLTVGLASVIFIIIWI